MVLPIPKKTLHGTTHPGVNKTGAMRVRKPLLFFLRGYRASGHSVNNDFLTVTRTRVERSAATGKQKPLALDACSRGEEISRISGEETDTGRSGDSVSYWNYLNSPGLSAESPGNATCERTKTYLARECLH